MIIDAHQHVWDQEVAEYEWLTHQPLPELDRRIDFAELEPVLDRLHIDATVLVQAADNMADTALMLATADRHPRVAGIVAWAPLDAPSALQGHLDGLLADRRVVGVRVLIHDRAVGWIESPQVDQGIGILSNAGLAYDYVTSTPAALAAVPRIAGRHPALRLIIDHLGKPPVGGSYEQFLRWRGLLADCAAYPHVSAKISGLYPAADPRAAWSSDSIRPFVESAIELFGTERLMYGGDWPISNLAGGYERVWEAVTEIVEDLTRSERENILGATAKRVYGLPEVRS